MPAKRLKSTKSNFSPMQLYQQLMAVKGWAFSVRARHLESNFCRFQFEPQAKRLIFSCIMTLRIANLRVLAWKLHYVTFGVITRNITRLSKIHASHWFIRVFDEPGFLLIRRSLVRAQVEEPLVSLMGIEKPANSSVAGFCFLGAFV